MPKGGGPADKNAEIDNRWAAARQLCHSLELLDIASRFGVATPGKAGEDR